VAFAQDYYRVGEGDTYAVIKVVRNSLPVSHLEVWFDTADRSATAGDDYDHSSGVLVFDVGVSEATFVVGIIDDDVPERLEEISLLLRPSYNGSSSSASLGPPAVLLVSDDDPAPVPSTLPSAGGAASRASVTTPARPTQAGASGADSGGQQAVGARQAAAVRRKVTTRQSSTTPFELRVQSGGGGADAGSTDLAVDPALAVLAGLLLAVVAGKVWFACRPGA
jgi:hypothetical protein